MKYNTFDTAIEGSIVKHKTQGVCRVIEIVMGNGAGKILVLKNKKGHAFDLLHRHLNRLEG